METVQYCVDRFIQQERPTGILLDGDTVLAQAVAATRLYAGYAGMVADEAATITPDVSAGTIVSVSEWAVIRPLFVLYVERETSLQLEASRGLGVDVFGRSSSEVAGEILQYEADLPKRAFYQPIITV